MPSFKSREDIYTTKTFESAEEATAFVGAIAQGFKAQGYKISTMEIREAMQGYGLRPNVDEEESFYVGQVAAYKEVEKKEDAPSTDEAPAKVN